MNSGFNLKSLLVSIVVGIIVVLFFSWASGSRFDTSLFPVLAMLTGFIITGFIIAIITKGVTIIEPALGSIIVASITYFILPTLKIKGFAEINQDSDWIIILMNAVVLTFLGAWLGEMFQHGELTKEDNKALSFNWGWVFAGTIFGILISIIIAIVVNLIVGNEPFYFIIPFFIGLFFTGIMVGLKSPGITIKEAGLSGFLTITILISIVRLTLVTEIEFEYIILGLVLGYVVAMLGGLAGEKIQSGKEKTA
ncbi:MAG: hypothetical protein EPN82_04995 [Bacteroidetes bacterium]|nr:MAG: hypothetical protein EPN82_04995 [Bacteroidota bacterium]